MSPTVFALNAFLMDPSSPIHMGHARPHVYFCPPKDIDTLDVQARQEPLKIRGEPQLLQLPLVPAYALTIHKTQVLERGERYDLVSVGVVPAEDLPGCVAAAPIRTLYRFFGPRIAASDSKV